MSETRNWVDQLWELEFITALFTWIFNLLSRVAEPLMTLAVIYTIIVAGIPNAYQAVLYNTAIAVMIGSPEIILPGAFIVAGQEQKAGNKRAWMLFTVCGCFVILTALTLADLFIFHFGSQDVAVLMCGRCVIGVSYSIIVRMVNHHGESSELSGSPRAPRSPQKFTDVIMTQVSQINQQLVRDLNGLQREFMNQVLVQVDQMNQQLVHDLHGSQQAFMNQAEQATQAATNQATTQIEQASARCIEELTTVMAVLTSPMPGNKLRLLAPSQNETTRRGSRVRFRPEQEMTRAPVHPSEPASENVHAVHNMPPLSEARKRERAKREQVCAFILNHWREQGSKPTIQFVMNQTGCSKGLASTCCNLVAQEIGV